jgi:glycosyltransferase involved in cell wall biosynthesis
MIARFDACVGLSKDAERYFRPKEVPFLWMPGGCSPAPARNPAEEPLALNPDGPLRLGYFGALAPHAGVEQLIQTFLATEVLASLEICGYGKMGKRVAQLAHDRPSLRYHGLLTPTECLRFGESCDLLINPRPATHGNQNNFPSKLFDYALTATAILTSTLSGVENVLGPDAFYFDPYDFDSSLRQSLQAIAATSREELRQRGATIRERVLSEFSWRKQGARLAQFIGNPLAAPVNGEPAQALAA